jgi:Na+-driven multidrug efflux pump
MIDKMMLEGGIIDMQKKIDLINGPILSSLTKLALPIMATSLIQMAYNMIDMIWIGRLGSSAVASVGAAGMYMWLSNGLVTLARMGGQVHVGHAVGAGRTDFAGRYATSSWRFVWTGMYDFFQTFDCFLSLDKHIGYK